MSSTPPSGAVERRVFARIAVVCCLAYLFLGLDLNIYGTTAPALIDEWQLSPAHAGGVGSYLPIGMMIGAIGVTTVVNVIGARAAITGAVVLSSVATALGAVAPSVTVLGLLLLVAGIGLGALQPPLIAYTLEYAPAKHRNLVYVVMASLAGAGGALTPALAIPIIPNVGWRALYLLCALPMLVIVPIAVTSLPESLESLVTRGKLDRARRQAARLGVAVPEASSEAGGDGALVRRGLRGIGMLFSRSYVVPTLLFWVAMFCSSVLIFAMIVWLPELMRKSGLSLSSALSILVALNLGAVVGPLVGAVVADRFDNLKPVVVVAFLAFAAGTGLVLVSDSGVFAYFVLAGVGVGGTQILFQGYQSQYYPIEARATGLGWAGGVGQLGGITGPALTGVLVGAQTSLDTIFLVFTGVAILAALLVAFVPAAKHRSPGATTPAPASDGADAPSPDASRG